MWGDRQRSGKTLWKRLHSTAPKAPGGFSGRNKLMFITYLCSELKDQIPSPVVKSMSFRVREIWPPALLLTTLWPRTSYLMLLNLTFFMWKGNNHFNVIWEKYMRECCKTHYSTERLLNDLLSLKKKKRMYPLHHTQKMKPSVTKTAQMKTMALHFLKS